jgi:hypothetical protein
MSNVSAVAPSTPAAAKIWLKVGSFEELLKNEAAILESIAKAKDGVRLFLTHPFQLLADIGVELAPEVVAELVKRDPRLGTLSGATYAALRDSKAKPANVTFHLKGLFNPGVK